MLVPFAAGGNIDVMGRLMASRLSETIGQQVIVENRVGGNGIVATEAVARAAPDGYTLLWASTSVIAIVPAAAKVPYDPHKDLAPIGAMTAGPQVLLVNSNVPAKNVQEFVAWVKAQSAKVAYGGGGGPASASNLIMSLFQKRAGIEMTNVSYRGTAPALTDLIAGHIPTMFVAGVGGLRAGDQSERPPARGVERETFADAARPADHRGVGLSRLRRGVLDRNDGAGGNAQGDRRQAWRRRWNAP